jgi:NAD(P)-dependent dehydrogenase (short-subunit alcohol dehydrogenase family)
VTKRLEGRLALVTGASRGLGAAVAKRFAAEGAHVILLARSREGLERVDDAIRRTGASATLIPLDLRRFGQIEQLAASIEQRFGRLDILVSCAAVLGHLSPTGHFPAALWREVMDVNLAANWHLIAALDPLLQRSPAGRSVFTTCEAARLAPPFWGAYAASKAGLETMIRVYANEIGHGAMRANLVDPGPMRTDLRAAAFPFEDRAALKSPEDATEAFVALAETGCTRNGERVAA